VNRDIRYSYNNVKKNVMNKYSVQVRESENEDGDIYIPKYCEGFRSIIH